MSQCKHLAAVKVKLTLVSILSAHGGVSLWPCTAHQGVPCLFHRTVLGDGSETEDQSVLRRSHRDPAAAQIRRSVGAQV